MATAEEVRQRVRANDEARINDRAERAIAVAKHLDDIEGAERHLATLRSEGAALITDALGVMELSELAAFTGRSTAKLTAARSAGRKTATRGRNARPKNGTAIPTAPPQV